MLKRNFDNLTWLIIANNKGTLSKPNDTQEKMILVRYIIFYIKKASIN